MFYFSRCWLLAVLFLCHLFMRNIISYSDANISPFLEWKHHRLFFYKRTNINISWIRWRERLFLISALLKDISKTKGVNYQHFIHFRRHNLLIGKSSYSTDAMTSMMIMDESRCSSIYHHHHYHFFNCHTINKHIYNNNKNKLRVRGDLQ